MERLFTKASKLFHYFFPKAAHIHSINFLDSRVDKDYIFIFAIHNLRNA